MLSVVIAQILPGTGSFGNILRRRHFVLFFKDLLIFCGGTLLCYKRCCDLSHHSIKDKWELPVLEIYNTFQNNFQVWPW
jgi:hypothetical protein